MSKRVRWPWFLAAGIIMWSFLAVYWPEPAISQAERAPFGNSVAQRNEMIQQLRAIKALLKEQNELLQDIVADGKKATP